MTATTTDRRGTEDRARQGDGRRRLWAKRIAWFAALYAVSAAAALGLAYGLRALLFL